MWVTSTDLDLACDGCRRTELITAGSLRHCWADARGWRRRGALVYCPDCRAQRGELGGGVLAALEWLWESIHRFGG